jgi:hypothetical protein
MFVFISAVVFVFVTPYNLVGGCQCFGGTCCTLTLKMGAACSSETLLLTYKTTQCQPRRQQSAHLCFCTIFLK